MEKRAFYASMIVVAACLWGVIGVFTSELEADGLTSTQVTEVRCAVTAIGLYSRWNRRISSSWLP